MGNVAHPTLAIDLPQSPLRGSPSFWARRAPKIGGVPSVDENIDWIDGRYICSLGPIQSVPEWPHPFVNRKEPLTLENTPDGDCYCDEDKTFGLSDMGCLSLFLRGDGSINSYFWTH